MILVLLLIAVLPLKQHPIWTGSGGEASGIKYLGAACVVYAVIHLVKRGRRPHYLDTWQARWFLLFFLVCLCSYLRTGLETSGYILVATSLFLLYFIVLSVVDSVARLRWVVLTTIGSLAWTSLYVLREWQQHRGWVTWYRGAWVAGDENYFAVSAISAIPLAWYMSQERSVAWERWFCRCCLLLIVVATLLAASRGGLLGLVAAMLFAAARSRQRMRNALIALVFLGVFNLAYPRSPLQRFLHPNSSDTGSEMAHQAAWQAGLGMFRTHPITGVGIAAFRSQMLHYAPPWYDGAPSMAHNAYISVAAETGIPGLLVFLSVLVAAYFNLERVYRMRSAPLFITRTAVSLQASLIGSSISICFISGELHENLWLVVFLSMCLPPLSARFRRGHKTGRKQVERGDDSVLTSRQIT